MQPLRFRIYLIRSIAAQPKSRDRAWAAPRIGALHGRSLCLSTGDGIVCARLNLPCPAICRIGDADSGGEAKSVRHSDRTAGWTGLGLRNSVCILAATNPMLHPSRSLVE